MDTIEVLITLQIAENLVGRLSELSPRLRITVLPVQKPEEIAADVWSRVEVLYTNRVIPAIDQAPKLRWIQFHWAGVDHALDAPILSKPDLIATTLSGAAASQVAEYVLAMKQGIGLNKILGTIHIYPTLAEANKYVAGNWKKAHAPQKLLGWVERFHAWRRG